MSPFETPRRPADSCLRSGGTEPPGTAAGVSLSHLIGVVAPELGTVAFIPAETLPFRCDGCRGWTGPYLSAIVRAGGLSIPEDALCVVIHPEHHADTEELVSTALHEAAHLVQMRARMMPRCSTGAARTLCDEYTLSPPIDAPSEAALLDMHGPHFGRLCCHLVWRCRQRTNFGPMAHRVWPEARSDARLYMQTLLDAGELERWACRSLHELLTEPVPEAFGKLVLNDSWILFSQRDA